MNFFHWCPLHYGEEAFVVAVDESAAKAALLRDKSKFTAEEFLADTQREQICVEALDYSKRGTGSRWSHLMSYQTKCAHNQVIDEMLMLKGYKLNVYKQNEVVWTEVS